jgi:uracil phosphoribosyltransferase
MKIGIGSDHAGFEMKESLKAYLGSLGIEVLDFGTESAEAADYPDIGYPVAKAVAGSKVDMGVLICGSGIGMSIVANKVPGVRAALVGNPEVARLSREHNNANILVLGARVTSLDDAKTITKVFLETGFAGGRHKRRVDKIVMGETRKEEACMSKVHLIDHPLIQHKLSLVRDKNTGSKDFRDLVAEISTLMAYEVTRDLPLEKIQVETPIGTADAQVISGKKVGIIAVLRAGLGMIEGMLRLIPTAKVGHIGIYRDPDTLQPIDYYCKLPPDVGERDLILVDPMLATGGSATSAIRFLKDRGATNIKLVVLVAAPEGIKMVQDNHPDVDIYTAAVDKCLNSHGYIVPGLGDAGDRLFGTK